MNTSTTSLQKKNSVTQIATKVDEKHSNSQDAAQTANVGGTNTSATVRYSSQNPNNTSKQSKDLHNTQGANLTKTTHTNTSSTGAPTSDNTSIKSSSERYGNKSSEKQTRQNKDRRNNSNKIINFSGKIQLEENFQDIFQESINDDRYERKITEGEVVDLTKEYVTLDVGLKSEGNVPLQEFYSVEKDAKINIGDKFNVYIERFENRKGEIILSREKAVRDEAWKYFENLFHNNETVDGKILSRVNGGFAVDLGGLIAFLPGSQVDIRPIKNINALVSMVQPFKILKMDPIQGNIVVSRRMILEDIRKEARVNLLSNIQENTILEGRVKNITDYGAFIDLGSTDGLLHITDISWTKINHPSQVLSIGEQIKVMVIKYNPDSERISLGLKQLTKNPWEDAPSQKYKVGNTVKGKITNIVDYGAFVELEPNIEGLVYYTEIGWLTKNTHPLKLINVGQEVDVKILNIDVDKHRISLSMKRCIENPWAHFIETNPIGTKINCVVRNVSDFGLFVTLEEDKDKESPIVMLIPSIELTWYRDHLNELRKYKKRR